MPHPEQEHALMIEVARLQKRVDDGDATARILVKDVRAWSDTCDKLRESLAAANARADAAEADIHAMHNVLNKARSENCAMRVAKEHAEEALAAARRECEGLRSALHPFALLGAEIMRASSHLPDDKPLYGFGEAPAVTAGHLRRAALTTVGQKSVARCDSEFGHEGDVYGCSLHLGHHGKHQHISPIWDNDNPAALASPAAGEETKR